MKLHSPPPTWRSLMISFYLSSMQIFPSVQAALLTLVVFTLLKIGSSSSKTNSGMAQPGSSKFPIYVEEDVMAPKAHGTTPKPVMKNLRWNVNYETADRISSFNRHYAEQSGYWETTDFLNQVWFSTDLVTLNVPNVQGKCLYIG